MPATPVKQINAGVLRTAYEEHGPADASCIILLHGFPYDPRCFDALAYALAAAGSRVIIPYLRGYGATIFQNPAAMRSGQQAALAQDLLDLMDGLKIQNAGMMGYDWGGRAACIAAALWPARVKFLVTGQGYNIQDIPGATAPLSPEAEQKLWYQYYFNTERGRAGLAANRRALGHLLWRLWSPSWNFDESTYAATAAAFENPDFVEVVIHSYRHRFGYVEGDPAYAALETALAAQPPIAIPTIALWGEDDGVRDTPRADPHAHKFTGAYQRRLLPGIGHNIPQEAPEATLSALLDLLTATA
jgi:pimeloyl-ACP methyl ester carboxylesterase